METIWSGGQGRKNLEAIASKGLSSEIAKIRALMYRLSSIQPVFTGS